MKGLRLGALLVVVLVATAPMARAETPAETRGRGEGGPAPASLRVAFSCGWAESWHAVIADARRSGPEAFRRTTMSRVGAIALPAFGLGVGLVLLLTVRRPRRPSRSIPRSPSAASGVGVRRWLRVLRDVTRAGLGRLVRGLDLWRLGSEARLALDAAIDDAHEADRQLRAAQEVLRERSAAPEPHIEATSGRLDAFRGELLRWAAALPLEPLPETAPLAAELSSRLARDVRLAILRAAVRGVAPDWLALAAELDARPPLPGPQPLAPLPRASWIPRAAVGSLALMGLGAVLLGAWFAAGAAPLFFAGVFAATGLVLMAAARLAQRHAARGPLFPGPVEQVARWLTRLTGLALALALASAATDTESGLDLGDPPPLPLPDPDVLNRPAPACDVGLCAPLPEEPPK